MNVEKYSILSRRTHGKASEEYVDVIFVYGDESYKWSIPIEYRRTGTHLHDSTEQEITDYVEKIYEICSPTSWDEWREAQVAFWAAKPRAATTKAFFDGLAKDFSWQGVSSDLPANSNPQRRIQDLKEFGYTLATHTNLKNPRTGVVGTHHLLLPIPRGGVSGYETWSPKLRARILQVLGGYDAYEGKVGNLNLLLPDHKFPEIRWDNTVRRESLEDLTDEDIIRDFQLLTNQRNQQKREACRQCAQSSIRPTLFGVEFYAKGSETWPTNVPTRGKEAEEGCKGCGWFDIEVWRKTLNSKLSDDAS